MDEHTKMARRLMSKGKFTVTQAICIADLFLERNVSWTFAPATVKHALWPLMEQGMIGVFEKTFEDDTQVYEFVAFTKEGLDMVFRRTKS